MDKTKNRVFLTLIISDLFLWDVLEKIHTYFAFLYLGIIFLFFVFIYKKIILHRNEIVLFIFLILHGVFSITLMNNSPTLFVKQLLAIIFCFTCFSSIIDGCDITEIFHKYWISAILMSCFGIVEVGLAFVHKIVPPFFIFSKLGSGIRFIWLASLCREPSFLGYYLAPAVAAILMKIICTDEVNKEELNYIKAIPSVLILFAMFMTFSTTAYIGIVTALVIGWLSRKINFSKLLLIFAILIGVVLIYNLIPDIRERIYDLFALFSNDGRAGNNVTNLSSFTFYSNFVVSIRGFLDSFGMGNGLGSYPLIYEKFNIGGWNGTNIMLNSNDGNSMLFRIITELGIFGIAFIVLFLVKYFPNKNNKYYIYSCSMLTLFIMLLIRQGNYTHGGIILFVCLYYKCYKQGTRYGKLNLQ